MIKANELRIGNIVSTNTAPEIDPSLITGPFYCKIMGVGSKDSWISYVGSIGGSDNPSNEDLNPIELTDDWMKKCGFRPFNSLLLGLAGSRNIFAKKVNDKQFKLYFDSFLSDVSFIQTVNYLHQLQNLYFYLTGQELKVAL